MPKFAKQRILSACAKCNFSNILQILCTILQKLGKYCENDVELLRNFANQRILSARASSASRAQIIGIGDAPSCPASASASPTLFR